MQPGLEPFPSQLPLLPLKDIVVFPQMILPVFVSEDICLKAVDKAMAGNRFLFLSAFKTDSGSSQDLPELASHIAPPFDVYDIGTVALVMRTRRLPDGRTKVLIQGLEKARAVRLLSSEGFPLVEIARVEELSDEAVTQSRVEATVRTVREKLEKLVALGKNLSPDILMVLEDLTCPGKLADLIASHLGLKIIEAQRILGTAGKLARLERVLEILGRELEVFNMQVKIQSQAREEMSKNQREHFLREQLKAIRSELGEFEGKDDVEELREKVYQAEMSAEAKEEALKQVKRLERMNAESSEATITRTYVEWLIDLPWNRTSEEKVELRKSKTVLDKEHYGLDRIKDRVLEYLAVRKLNPEIKGPILCFVGPPGVGKTSLGRSIASSLGRKFVRISLGGLRDEAEIRGHRRTYVGSHPGRIIQALKTSGVRNPVIMLDEIDKLGSDYKGDPGSALLEVLDPEQNHTFSDHYISLPFDLSQVVFIANANRLDSIPAPLLDRLEIIEVSGYTHEEKFEIAKQFIIPKSVERNGLPLKLIQFQDPAIDYVIENYTRESGLRNLEKQMSAIARKLARSVAEKDEEGQDRRSVKVTTKLVRTLLGQERFLGDNHQPDAERVGVAIGLAYTQTGGEILELEVNLVPGKGSLTLTGHLGEVMKESAQASFSYVRSRAVEFGISANILKENDVHLHIPAGAIPKDGPSAGVAIATALVSLLLDEPIRQDVAMTGEITLHGRVLPVGGLKEKVLAAARSGIRIVCVPERNRSAISELPVTLRRKVDIRFVSSIDEILRECFRESPGAKKLKVQGAAKRSKSSNRTEPGSMPAAS
jgi:ATP-dependent Lon protease